jgi:hypothetical protein
MITQRPVSRCLYHLFGDKSSRSCQNRIRRFVASCLSEMCYRCWCRRAARFCVCDADSPSTSKNPGSPNVWCRESRANASEYRRFRLDALVGHGWQRNVRSISPGSRRSTDHRLVRVERQRTCQSGSIFARQMFCCFADELCQRAGH